MSRYRSDREFEDEVRRVADALFDLPAGACKPENYTKGRTTVEVDGVARSRGIVHLIMATTSTKLDKVHEDVERLEIADAKERQRGCATGKWLVVEKPPEAPHVTEARKSGVTLLTLAQFRERFFDGSVYLSRRGKAPFGSSRDIATGNVILSADEFIEPPLVEIGAKRELALGDLVSRLLRGEVVVLLGPFGCGKSLTVRELWYRLAERYGAEPHSPVPIALNLREHWGALYADEILSRHARSIGLPHELNLVAAWRAEMVLPLVDGFDEVASQGVLVLGDLRFLRQNRWDALRGVRDLISQSSPSVGLLLAGRDHYFDDRSELMHSLGLDARKVSYVRVEEFDDARAKKYLVRRGVAATLPDWLPRRPLLLGYLAAKEGLLDRVLSIDGREGQAAAWGNFLDLICAREAALNKAAMDHETLCRVMGRLALMVRSSASGDGPISPSMLAQAYTDVTEQVPGDAVIMQLQRLPGLTERGSTGESRSFIDRDLLDTLQGVAVASELVNAASTGARGHSVRLDDRAWYDPLRSLGCGVAVLHFRKSGWTLGGVCDFLGKYSSTQFGADLLQIALTWAAEDGVTLELHGVGFTGVHVGTVDLDEVAVCDVTFADCVVDSLEVGAFAAASRVTILDCVIGRIVGVASADRLPPGVALAGAVEVQEYETLQTTDAIVRLDVEDSIKALFSALRRLFRQRGAGRVAGAFARGVPPEVRKYVEPVLHLLVREGIAWQQKDVYHPVWSQARRANAMLDSPGASEDPLIARVKAM
jgi:hypothetical protein